jgi:hypothetical protein
MRRGRLRRPPAQRLAADAGGIVGLGVVAVPPDGDVPVPPAGAEESRWPHAPSKETRTSADAQTTDVIRMAKLPMG